ncbi:MAG: tetratricopeptide repeat protein [Chloroflexi bacterium]|nr:tetratricopeptide repeat protein [Chloroflexota bacterium]
MEAVQRQRWFIPPITAQIRETEYVDKPDEIVRAEKLETIQHELLRHRRVSIVGAGGMGKTFLAEMLATRYRSFYGGGVLFLTLSPEDNDPVQLTARMKDRWSGYYWSAPYLAHLTGQAELTDEEFRRRIAQIDAPLLVVLDNVWDAEAAAALMKRLLPSSVYVLVTSRREDIPQQMAVQRQFEISSFDHDESAAFLKQQLGPTAISSQIETIADVFAGLPLALALSVTVIKRNLRHNRDYVAEFLADIQRNRDEGTLFDVLDVAEREKNLEAVLALSYQQMDSDLQLRFRALGALPVEIPVNARMIAAVARDERAAEGDPVALRDAQDRADALVTYGLLAKLESGSIYQQHRAYWVYARSLLQREQGERALDDLKWAYEMHICDASSVIFDEDLHKWQAADDYIPHVEHVGAVRAQRAYEQLAAAGYADAAALAAPEMPSDTRSQLEKLGAEQRSIFAPLSYFSTSVHVYIRHCSQVGSKGRNWLEAGLIAARALDLVELEARHVHYIAEWYIDREQNTMAQAYLDALAEIDPQLETSRMASSGVRNMLARFKRNLGQLDEAQAIYEALYDESNGQGLGYLSSLFSTAHQRGDVTACETYLARLKRDMLTQAEKDPFTQQVWYLDFLDMRGALASMQGRWDDAARHIEAALEARQRMGFEASKDVISAAQILSKLGQNQAALERLRQAETEAQSAENQGQLAVILTWQGTVLAEVGRAAEALPVVERAGRLLAAAGLGFNARLQVLNALGLAQLHLSDFDEAIQHFRAALQIVEETGVRASQGVLLSNLSQCYLLSGQLQRAHELLEQIRSLPSTPGNLEMQTLAFHTLSLFHTTRGNLPLAQQMAEQALDLSQQANSSGRGAMVRLHLSDVLSRQKLWTEALEQLRLGRADAEQANIPDGVHKALLDEAAICFQLDEHEEARALLRSVTPDEITNPFFRSIYWMTKARLEIVADNPVLARQALDKMVHSAHTLAPARRAAVLARAAGTHGELGDYQAGLALSNDALRTMANHRIQYLETGDSIADVNAQRIAIQARSVGKLRRWLVGAARGPFLVSNLLGLLVVLVYNFITDRTLRRLEKSLRKDGKSPWVTGSQAILVLIVHWPRILLFPQRQNPRLEVAIAWTLLGRPARAIRIYSQVIELPEFIGVTLAGFGSLGEDNAGYRYAFVSMKANAYFMRGMLLLNKSEWQAAVADFDAALAHHEGLSNAHFQRGKLAHYIGEHEKTLQHFLRARSLDRTTDLYWVGRAHTAVGELDAALATYSQELREKPGDALIHYWRALVRIERDPFDPEIERDLALNWFENVKWKDRMYNTFWLYVTAEVRGDATGAAQLSEAVKAIWQEERDADDWGMAQLLNVIGFAVEAVPIPDDAKPSALSNLRYYLDLLAKLYPVEPAIPIAQADVCRRIDRIFD